MRRRTRTFLQQTGRRNRAGVFEEEAKKIGAVDYLAQGTIYPDVVESGLGGESATIKSHHNVGGLPDFVDFKEIVEPLRDLFKDEVRQSGRELGLPEYLVTRQPFPGPGLAIRIIGEVTAEKVAIVQDADYIYRERRTHLRLRHCPACRNHHRLYDGGSYHAAPCNNYYRSQQNSKRSKTYQPRAV